MTGSPRERQMGEQAETQKSVRLDTWLWAARFFKTRALAARAIDGGKVKLNGERAKRSKEVTPGDEIRVKKGPYEFVVIVRGLSEKRGPASEARTLYEETPESVWERQNLKALMRAEPLPVYKGKGRPTKKERRAIERETRRLGGG
ncbi:Heat shock protein 15 [bacterium HR33]|nr:Heat shock protein 15 [bacterium HR33]